MKRVLVYGRKYTIVALVSGLILMALLAVPPAEVSAQSALVSAQTFSDVRGNEWFAEAVNALATQGITYGRDDGTFAPNDPVTRAQLAAFLFRALHLPDSMAAPFGDVKIQDWFFGSVAAMYEAGLVTGTSPDTYSPNSLVSRQQAATMVLRSLGYVLESQPQPGVEYGLPDDQVGMWLLGFRDRGLISPAHAPFVANAYRLGVVEGAADGWFYPDLTLSRAQMAVMLYRALLQPITVRPSYPAEYPAVSSYESLKRGSEGSLVSFLEARLTALGYPCGPVDGVYDYRTADAVMAFEKVERLDRDGAVGAEVWRRFLAAQAPKPRLNKTGYRVEVDLARQVLFMIDDGKVTKIVHVSTGRLGTPTGHGTVNHKTPGWYLSSVGWMYASSYFMPKIAIHGSKSVPSYPASHGCVRVPMWTADELYEQLVLGTPVDVYY